MALFTLITTLLFFLLSPALVVYICNRNAILKKIGPIMVLYAVGIIIGNIPMLPNAVLTLQELLPNIMVPLAIPMMLFGCSFSRNEWSLQLRVVVSGFLSVAIAVGAGYVLFGKGLNEGTEIGGIISGMYTGGTINAAALQTIFQTSGSTYTLINSYDIIISFAYFIFLFSFGIRLFRRIYGEPVERVLVVEEENDNTERDIILAEKRKYNGMFTREGLKEMAKIFLCTIVIVAISGGTAIALPEEWFMVVFILMITTLGVAASFIRPIRELKRSYDIGMYLIYIQPCNSLDGRLLEARPQRWP